MKIISTILFTVLLTSLVYFTSSQLNQHQLRKFNNFLYRLESALNSTGFESLSFELTVDVIGNLKLTSDEFKNLCLDYEAELFFLIAKNEERFLSPIWSLNRTIKYLFYYYNKSAKKNVEILKGIERVDPIGLNVYLTKKNVENSSPTFMDFVVEFEKAMHDRLRLFKMKTDDSYFSNFVGNDCENLKRLPRNIRYEITAEYLGTSEGPIDMFTNLVTELTSKKMYRIRTDPIGYQTHNSSTIDDVQIIYGTYSHNTGYRTGIYETNHAVCINYKASTQKVHVYDSLVDRRLDDRQLDVIGRLYPYNIGIIFERPKTVQENYHTCAIFAILYATMLLLDTDPAATSIKLNRVHGDESLYMRMHILNVLGTRKLSLME